MKRDVRDYTLSATMKQKTEEDMNIMGVPELKSENGNEISLWQPFDTLELE